MYIAVALIWLRVVDGVALARWDVTGAVITLVGMGVIALRPTAGWEEAVEQVKTGQEWKFNIVASGRRARYTDPRKFNMT